MDVADPEGDVEFDVVVEEFLGVGEQPVAVGFG